ncbi:MAG: hypothetical protein FWF59_11800 [Turicibacter sp.]|nr:hypothetical protein [Turicibacter sp.]
MKPILKNAIQFAFFVLLIVAILDLLGPGYTPTPYHFVPVRNVSFLP